MLRELVVASRNPKKAAELQELLASSGIQVTSLAEFPGMPEVVEDGTTFAENAAKKARETALHIGRWVVAEDSGLCVDALGGAPGLCSARYSDPGATDARNNAKLIDALRDVPDEQRSAHYVCHACVADPQGTIRLAVEETCRGTIVREPRGTNGFGYDPYFLVRELHATFGELDPAVKRAISHRARALRKLVAAIVATP